MTDIQALIDAVALGSIYAVIAVGIGLVFGVMRLVNFAYGELITAGGFTLWWLRNQPAGLAIVCCFAVVIALALVMERVAFRPLRTAAPATMLVATFAVSYLLQSIYLLIFGPRGNPVSTLAGLNTAVSIGSLHIRWVTFASLGVGAGLLLGTAFILGRTEVGLHMRAAAVDFRTARVLGVRANRVIAVAFMISGFLAACVSVLLTVSDQLVTPTYGVQVTIFALVAVVVGGLDRLWTATLGGFSIGFAYSLLGDELSGDARVYLPSLIFGLVIVVLLLRPGGLFAPAARRLVERM